MEFNENVYIFQKANESVRKHGEIISEIFFSARSNLLASDGPLCVFN